MKKQAQPSILAAAADLGGSADFMTYLRSLLSVGDRVVFMRGSHNLGGWTTPEGVYLPDVGTVYVTLINLPEDVVKAGGGGGGGAESENNRLSLSVEGFNRLDAHAPNPEGRRRGLVQVSMSVNAIARRGATNLRGRTARPSQIAAYIAGYLNHVVATVPPHFTHTSGRSAGKNQRFRDHIRNVVDNPGSNLPSEEQIHSIVLEARARGLRYTDEQVARLAAIHGLARARKLVLLYSPADVARLLNQRDRDRANVSGQTRAGARGRSTGEARKPLAAMGEREISSHFDVRERASAITLHNVTKSVAEALTGAAIETGIIRKSEAAAFMRDMQVRSLVTAYDGKGFMEEIRRYDLDPRFTVLVWFENAGPLADAFTSKAWYALYQSARTRLAASPYYKSASFDSINAALSYFTVTPDVWA